MAAAFQGYLAEYAKTGGDPEKIDLEQLKEDLGRNFEGELDLYVINETGVIICSTVPEVIGLDLSAYPDYHDMLPKLRQETHSPQTGWCVKTMQRYYSNREITKIRLYAHARPPVPA
jgi:hypothetical protein